MNLLDSSVCRQLFLLFMSFSLAVEGLHAFIEDESEHKYVGHSNSPRVLILLMITAKDFFLASHAFLSHPIYLRFY